MKNCRTIQKKLTAYLHGELNAADQSLIETHLAECESCRTELDAQRAALRLLAETLESAPAPERLVAKQTVPEPVWKQPERKEEKEPHGWSFRLAKRFIEVAAVLVIFLFLFAVSVPLMTANKDKAVCSEAVAGLGGINTACRLYSVESGEDPDSFREVVESGHFKDEDLDGSYFSADDYSIDSIGDLGNGKKGVTSATVVDENANKVYAMDWNPATKSYQMSVEDIDKYSKSSQVIAKKDDAFVIPSSVRRAENRPKMKLKKLQVNAEKMELPKDQMTQITAKTAPVMPEMQLPKMTQRSVGAADEVKIGGLEMIADLGEMSLLGGVRSAGCDTDTEEEPFQEPASKSQMAAAAPAEEQVFYELGEMVAQAEPAPSVEAEEMVETDSVRQRPARLTGSKIRADKETKQEEGWGFADAKRVRRELKPAGFNPYVMAAGNAFSTFSIDVDTASYGLVRQKLFVEHSLPEPERVRTEEFINSFDYDYRPPSGTQTFAVHSEMAPSPFRLGMDVLKIGVKGRRIGRDDHRHANLTLLIDTSGSMSTPERLGLIKESLALLINQLAPDDQVAIVQFGSQARLVLEHTPVSQKKVLLDAVYSLQAGGPTQFDEGLTLGYQQAFSGYRSGDSNRLIILSDGVANLGELDPDAILEQVADFRKKGIYLSVLGFGAGVYDDDLLERLADKGDGMYAYIDTLDQARHLLVDQLAATLHVIAGDVKIQVEFNPDRVLRYRQMGYENRQLTKEQFRDDTVDAGEVGSGQSVTALYDVELRPDGEPDQPVATVYVRYRRADTGAVEEISSPVTERVREQRYDKADARFRLAVCVAEFAEKLRRSPYSDGTEIRDILKRMRPVARELELDDNVQELIRLMEITQDLER